MITRIVKLTFRPEEVPAFLEIFEGSKNAIRNFPGCRHLELLRADFIFFTYSRWDDESALEQYRNSKLFQGTWARTKALFAARPEAWTVESLAMLD